MNSQSFVSIPITGRYMMLCVIRLYANWRFWAKTRYDIQAEIGRIIYWLDMVYRMIRIIVCNVPVKMDRRQVDWVAKFSRIPK